MVADDAGWRTALNDLLVRRSHLCILAQLFHRVKEHTYVLLGPVEWQGTTNLRTKMPTSSTFWFARLSVEGSKVVGQ